MPSSTRRARPNRSLIRCWPVCLSNHQGKRVSAEPLRQRVNAVEREIAPNAAFEAVIHTPRIRSGSDECQVRMTSTRTYNV